MHSRTYLTVIKYQILFFLILTTSVLAEPNVKVACNLPLTGARATYGQAVLESVELAKELLVNNLVEYTFDDNQSIPREALSVFRKQISTKPDIYISGVKPEHLAFREYLVQSKLPHFAWVFDLNLRPDAEPNFRTWVNFKIEPEVLINYAKKIKAKSVTIIGAELITYIEEYEKLVIPGLKAIGINDITQIMYPLDKTEFRDMAVRAKKSNSDLYILAGFQENLIGLLKAFNQLQIIKDGNTITTYDLLDAAPLLNNRFTEGVRVVAPKFLIEKNERFIKWQDAFIKKYNKTPLYTHAYAHDMAVAINEAAKIKFSNSEIKDWNSAIMKVDTEGLTGRIKFDSTGDLPYEITAGVYRSGKLELGL